MAHQPNRSPPRPTIKTHASVAISEDARRILKAAYGKAIAHVPGKSEQWLMCVFDGDAPIYMGGDDSLPSALIEVGVFARGAVPASAWQAMTEEITPVVAETLGIDPARIYISYSSTPDFGWNGGNF